jgi:hypothetical protein
MRRPRSRSAAVLLAFVLCTCTDATTGLRNGQGRLSLEPTYAREAQEIAHNLAAAGLTIDKVFVEVRGPAGDVRASQLVDFPADQTKATLTVGVRLTSARERLTATLQLRSATTPIFASETPVTVWQSQTTTAQTDPLTYVGPGAAAKVLKVEPPQATLAQTGTQQFSAAAFAANQSAVTDLPITGWTSSDPTIATVSPAGLVQALKSGNVTVTAHALNLLLGTASIHIVGLPSRVAILSGGSQSATVGTTLAQPFQVQVLSAAGEGVPGVTINFQALTSGSSVGTATAMTDVQGLAATSATLGTAAGAYEFRASIAGAGTGGPQPVSIAATAQAGAAATITKVSGDAQSGTSGQPLSAPLVVRVTDAYGNPVGGATVVFTRLAGTGAISTAKATTGADGLASTSYTLGTTSGSESIRADLSGATGVTATFSLTSNAGPPSAVTKQTGDGQHLKVGASPTAPLVALVTDSHGNPVPGVTVAWKILSGSGSLNTDHSVTDNAGEAPASFTTDGHAGTTVISATVDQSSIEFTVVVDVGAPSQITIVTGTNNQSAPAGNAVPVAPSVRVADSFGNPISGLNVTFSPGTSSGSVVGGSSATDANGVATVGRWTLGTSSGPQTLAVTAGELSTSFSATALPTLAITALGNGSGTVSSQPTGISCLLAAGSPSGTCSLVPAFNQIIELTASAASNSAFGGFGGVCAGKNPCSVTMSQSQTISASFSLVKRTLTIAGGAGNGRVTSSPAGIDCTVTNGAPAANGCAAQFDDGTAVMLARSSGSGFKFTNWGGACSGTGACTLAMTQDQAVRATFSLGSWSPMSIPTTAQLHGIWGSSATQVFAVGASGTVLEFDGSSWTSLTSSVNDKTIWDTWGSSASDVYAASEQLVHYDGGSWNAGSAPASLYGVWGSSPSDVYFSGDRGTLFHFDGKSTWTPIATGTSSLLFSIWGSSPTNIFVVGLNGTALHYDGQTVTPIDLPNVTVEPNGAREALGAVWGSSATDVWIGGGFTSGDLWHFDGTRWTKSALWTTPGSTGQGVNGIWGTSSSDIWAVGESSAFHFDGATWTSVPLPMAATLLRVWGSGPLDVFATGIAGGTGVILRYQ